MKTPRLFLNKLGRKEFYFTLIEKSTAFILDRQKGENDAKIEFEILISHQRNLCNQRVDRLRTGLNSIWRLDPKRPEFLILAARPENWQ